MTKESRHYDVIVVGAGIAGLTAAYRLTARGCRVKVLEAGPVPGGRVGDRETRGIRYNAGARLVYPFSKPFNALLDELGLTDEMIAVRRPGATCRGAGGNWLIELLPGMKSLMTPGLSLAERLRFVTYGAGLLATRAGRDPDDATTAMKADAVSLADYITGKLGPNVLERMVEPVFRGTRAWNAEDVSAAFFATTTPFLIGQGHVYAFQRGMGQLPAALARGLDISCDTRVTEVREDGTGCKVATETPAGRAELGADQVVMAVEGSRVAPLLPDLAPEDRAFFDGVHYNSLGIVHYRLNRDVPARLNFFARDVAGPIATYEQLPGNPETGRAPQLYAQLSPEAIARARAEGRTDDMHSLVEDRLRELYPTLDADCEDRVEQWIERKLPTFYPGYGATVRDFTMRQEAQGGRIAFCGDYLAQSLLTGASVSGEKAARQVLRRR